MQRQHFSPQNHPPAGTAQLHPVAHTCAARNTIANSPIAWGVLVVIMTALGFCRYANPIPSPRERRGYGKVPQLPVDWKSLSPRTPRLPRVGQRRTSLRCSATVLRISCESPFLPDAARVLVNRYTVSVEPCLRIPSMLLWPVAEQCSAVVSDANVRCGLPIGQHTRQT